MLVGDALHLSYCTNIHPAVGWDAVFASVREHAPALKVRLSPAAPFGIGLRLSGQESSELLEGDRLRRFRAWLDAEGLYVFTVNGFPHGTFHGGRVKADVHAPDWRTDERVAYTLRLARILAALLPDGVAGTISTNPLAYGTWLDGDPDGWKTATDNVRAVAVALRRLRERCGAHVALAIEPEADGALATCADLLRWFPEDLDREHVTVCLDACHAAVAFEEPARTLDALQEAGVRVGKVQLSAALRVALDGAEQRQAAGERLRAFCDPVYLHQVTRRDADGSLVGYPDLDEALCALQVPEARELRVHFHVPIFERGFGELASTQDHLREVLELVVARGTCSQLEIETYTWDVLPGDLKASPVEQIAREYEWVLDVVG